MTDNSLLTCVLVLLPLVSAVSSYYGNRLLLLLIYPILTMIFLIATTRRNNECARNKDRMFLLLVVSITLSLLLSQSLGSPNLIGSDIHQEYALFSQIAQNGFWQADVAVPYNSVLSVTIFPVVLNEVTGLDGITVFKIVFPTLLSLVPALSYLLYRKILPPESSAIATFVSVTSWYFYFSLIGYARQEVAEVFLMLLLLVLLSSKIRSGPSRVTLTVLLTIGLVTAHYLILYIYVAGLLLSLLLGCLFKKTFSELVSSKMLAVTVSAAVVWYVFVASGYDLIQLSYFFASMLRVNLVDFFELSTHPPLVSAAIGVGMIPGSLHYLNYAVSFLLNFALLVGFFVFVFKKHPREAEKKIVPFTLMGMLLIGAAVFLPYFSFGAGFGRIYQVALLFVAPCFVFGISFLTAKVAQLSAIIRHDSVRTPSSFQVRILAASVLVLFLLLSSGWVWSVSMDYPSSVLFDYERMLNSHSSYLEEYALYQYISPRDISAALWLKPQLAVGFPICSDHWTRYNVLTSYSGILLGSNSILTQYPLGRCNFRQTYVFLSVLNTNYGLATTLTPTNLNSTLPMTEFSSQLYPENIVYSDGGATIYLFPGLG